MRFTLFAPRAARVTSFVFLSCVLVGSVVAQRTRVTLIPNARSITDMSPDGRFILGGADDGGSFLLDRSSGLTTLLPSGGFANAVSDDGSVVLGGSIDNPDGVGQSVAGVWQFGDSAWRYLGHLPDPARACGGVSSGSELSADGSVAVGGSFTNGCQSPAVQWNTSEAIPLSGSDFDGDGVDDVLDANQTGGIDANNDGLDDQVIASVVSLPTALDTVASQPMRARTVSSDGTVIGGFAQTTQRTPAVWDGLTGEGAMLDPAGRGGEVAGIRDDGSVLLGQFFPSPVNGGLATKWVNQDGNWVPETVGAGSVNPTQSGTALDIADDDTVIGVDRVGLVSTGWIQPQGSGDLQTLRAFAVEGGATIPEFTTSTPFDANGDGVPDFNFEQTFQMEFTHPEAISSDGTVIAGSAFQIGIYSEGWIIEITDECDLDFDFDCDTSDIDSLTTAIASGETDADFDLNGDGVVSILDRDTWLSEAAVRNLGRADGYALGDANLDGIVDVSDFQLWLVNNTTESALWSQADFDANGQTDLADFQIWNENRFAGSSVVSSSLASVPEPNSRGLLIVALVVTMFGYRRRDGVGRRVTVRSSQCA